MNKRTDDWGATLRDRGILFLTIFLGTLVFFFHPVWAISGREIFEKVNDVRKAGLTRKVEATMILYDKAGRRSRSFIGYSKKGEGEAYSGLVIFETPSELKGVGFLVVARTFSDRKTWAYFPEYNRVRNIPISSQDDSFFGSDFSYDDFAGPPSLDDFHFNLLREEEIDGQPCYVIEVTPKKRRGYSRYIAWVSKSWSIPLKIDYYRDKERHKSGVFKDIRLIDQIPTPSFMEMTNQSSGHRTEITIQQIHYNPELPDSLFTLWALEQSGR